ncbi:Pleckstrin homology domain-containing family M member 3 [Trichoplax sp. H2]|nr:Pleckstrin homology domain-containing family M member 3 [Trichoplax sp. H2]|eukprot:RDD47719.1 Pleckstrin homology domain-containing family M member 3 [Trichoplax sp. H2]
MTTRSDDFQVIEDKTLSSWEVFDADNCSIMHRCSSLDPSTMDEATRTKMQLLTSIKNETGLDSQDYKCSRCNSFIGLIFGGYNVCNFDGCYYCSSCHDNGKFHVIPARLIHNWDSTEYAVCHENMKFLAMIKSEPLFDISKLNPSLYNTVPEMGEAKRLRLQMNQIKKYLSCCDDNDAVVAIERKILSRLYLWEDASVYSLQDLIEVSNGKLIEQLRSVVQLAMQHIKSCKRCWQKGYICELCRSEEVIFPFQLDLAITCPLCNSVYHQQCKKGIACRKCSRKTARALQEFQI